jgi:hypothetical protein
VLPAAADGSTEITASIGVAALPPRIGTMVTAVSKLLSWTSCYRLGEEEAEDRQEGKEHGQAEEQILFRYIFFLSFHYMLCFIFLYSYGLRPITLSILLL